MNKLICVCKNSMILLGAALMMQVAAAKENEIMVDDDNVAANGYDVVAYFDNRVSRGIPAFEIEYRGALWWFESEESAAKFQKDPELYEPVYGGYCAYGVSQGYLVATDPDAWSVVDGNLYLNYNAATRGQWLKKRDEFINLADKHWPQLIN